MTKLVIVESPAKCGKIQSFLGDGYKVIASMGHIRALEQKLDAIGIDKGWNPAYEDLSTKKEAISKLRKAAKEATEVLLAADDDREGEGIAWHVCHVLKLNPATTPRIVFHEITKTAIQAAVAAPRRLDMNRVNAQQARAMLDMLVGFTISRVLWKRVAPKLSAGRCQTPALRLVVERDTEIQNHTARNFWVLKGQLEGEPVLDMKTDGECTEEEVRAELKEVGQQTKKIVTVQAVKERVSTSNAPAPLITSTLQQEASASHGMGPKQSMAAAQKLYEAGHITYMRTDNPQLSVEAATAIRSQIEETWGEEYVGSAGQHQIGAGADAGAAPKKTKKAKKEEPAAPEAQAAHEAIRPTHPEVSEIEGVEHAQQVIYRLIWRRAVQSQMSAAKTDVKTVTLKVAGSNKIWTAEQTKPAFEGWRIVEQTEKTKASKEADELAWTSWSPKLQTGSEIAWSSVGADEIFTKPPGRFTEATLIRELEKRGIGRPSTFASLVTTLFDREYVEKTNVEGKVYETRHLTITPKRAKEPKESKETHKAGAEKNKIRATALGCSVTECLQRDFEDLFAYTFTAKMEQGLDEIATGGKEWKSILQETWDTYKERYNKAIAEKDARSTAIEGAESVKVIQTKRGPLLVRPKADGTGDEFAPLPTGVTAASAPTMTTEAIDAAFKAAQEAKQGEVVGIWEEQEMFKKKGPYGYYVESAGIKVPWKPEDTEETLAAKLNQKKTAFERKVGDFTIKQGPYGLYFYKHTLKKMTFKPFPKDKSAETVTATELAELYAKPAAPSRFVKKAKKE